MSVHSLPGKRHSSDGDGAQPASAALLSPLREQRQRVLIRHSWVLATEEPAAPGLDNSHPVDVGGETRLRRAA